MGRWDRSRALAAIEALALDHHNVTLAHYWLSLWSGEEAPARSRFDPARVKHLLPGIALIDIGDAAICRLSGTAIDFACGRAMQGANLLDYVSGEARRVRRARLEAIVDGGISVSRTRYHAASGRGMIAESVQLPFAGLSETGSRQYIAHTNWRPDGTAAANARKYDVGFPDEYAAIAFG